MNEPLKQSKRRKFENFYTKWTINFDVLRKSELNENTEVQLNKERIKNAYIEI